MVTDFKYLNRDLGFFRLDTLKPKPQPGEPLAHNYGLLRTNNGPL